MVSNLKKTYYVRFKGKRLALLKKGGKKQKIIKI